MNCPRCGEPMERDEVDVGVGALAAGPWGCFACQWVEGVTGCSYTPRARNEAGDHVCEHGTAMDVHCCGEGGLPYPGCHSGFLFDRDSCRCR